MLGGTDVVLDCSEKRGTKESLEFGRAFVTHSHKSDNAHKSDETRGCRPTLRASGVLTLLG